MSDVEAAFQILERLNDAKVEYIVVGGMAAVLLGAPIVTADVDIVHRRSPENVQRLLEVAPGTTIALFSDPEGHVVGLM